MGRAVARPASKRALLIGVIALLAVAGLVAAGLFEVRPGEVALAREAGGAVGRIYQPGWHWRPPWADPPRRLPREPIPLTHDLELRTAEGATIVVEVAGRYGVPAGAEREWARQAGWEPFAEALGGLLAAALEPAMRDADPARLFQPGAEQRLAELASGGLAAAGVRAEAVSVAAPPERNPVATAVVRNRLRELASPTGRKVLVVGWDGADWLMIEPLLAAGRLPNLAGLIARGARGELRSQPPLLSPLVWTTIATGKPVLEHGIADFLVRDPASGELVPISSASRKVHALWTLLPAFDLTTDVVGWWATWPAEPVAGTMVTDRVAYQLFEFQDDPSGEGNVHPPAAWGEIQGRLVSADAIPYERVRRFVEVSREEFERLWESLPPERRQEEKVNHLRKILATTESYHAIAIDLLEEQADLTLVYYEGTDTVGHLFARYLPPRMPGVSGEEVRRFGKAVPEFYEYADELLGELLAAVDDDTVVLLISDHGFFTGEARPASDPSDFAQGAPQWHRLYGVIVGAGPGVGRGTIRGATIFDVAPTVLRLLGLPVPEDMPGRPLGELLPNGTPPPPAARLASYEVLPRQRPDTTRVASADDRERLRELVALGYISPAVLDERGEDGGERSGGAPEPGTAGSASAGAATSESLEGVSTEAYNRGRIHQRQGDLRAAREQYRIAIERLPSFGVGYASLAQVAALEGDHSEAFDLLVEGFENSATMPMAAITGLVDEARHCGRLADAERALARLGPVYRRQSAYPAALGWLHELTGRPQQALEHYRQALALDPLDQLSVEQTVVVLRRLGREGEAREFLDRTFELARGKVTAMNQLAVVALRQGWAPDAERLLRRVLASDPGNPGVLANLAATLMRQGKTAEALEAMQQAVERDPGDARNHYNLGAMLADQGRPAEALAAFEKAEELGLRSARLHVAVAKMSFRLGDRARAEAELERALALEPGDPEARELLRILRAG